jgi:hypothetical protein
VTAVRAPVGQIVDPRKPTVGATTETTAAVIAVISRVA